MEEPLRESHIKLYRVLGEGIKADRLAIDMLLGAVAGDDLPEALVTLKELREKLPDRRDGRKNADRIFNEIGARGREMLDQAIHDLGQLLEFQEERDRGPKSKKCEVTGKRGYKSREDAVTASAFFSRTEQFKGQSFYRCPHCHRWHTTTA